MEVVTFPGTATDLWFEPTSEAAAKQSDTGPWKNTLLSGVLDEGPGFASKLAALGSAERDAMELVLGPEVGL